MLLGKPDWDEWILASCGLDEQAVAGLGEDLARYLQEFSGSCVNSKQEDLLKMEREMQIGRDIQLSFLPSELPQPPGWELAARFHPAREVAGDFYDGFTWAEANSVSTWGALNAGQAIGAIPAPGAIALLGLAGIAARRRRRH